MEQLSLEQRVAALERTQAEHAQWHFWERKATRPYPQFEIVDGQPIANAIKLLVFGACRLAWLLIRCAAMYAVGRSLLR